MKVFLILIFSFFFLEAYTQDEFVIHYKGDDFKEVKKNLRTTFRDSFELRTYSNDLISLARKKGYALASWKSDFKEDTVVVDLFLGQLFKDIYLSVPMEERFFIAKSISQREKLLLKLPFSAEGYSKSIAQIQRAYLNDGFPFAKVEVRVDSVRINDLFAHVDIQKGRSYTWKEVHVKGDSNIRSALLQNLLDIREGEIYRELQFEEISQKIAQVPYLQEVKPAELLFTPEGVELFVYVKVVPLSSLNGFLGLQPTPDNTGYKLAGDINLKLLNVFHKGEGLTLNWRNLQGITQQFNTQLTLPFLFKTPFGVDGKFYLYKRDSSFLDVQSRLAIDYSFTGNTKAFFFYQRKSSNVLSAGKNNATYSNLANVSSNNYGLGFERVALDYSPNPRKGYLISLSASVGQRTTQVSDTSDRNQNLQLNGESVFEWYLPIAKRNVLFFGNKSWTLNTTPLYQNEILRFGGLLWQRGFNEDDFFGSTVSTFSFEYRYLFDKNSRVFVFGDLTWYENNATTYMNDLPFGFGAGFAFGTEIGTFSLIYAIGSQRGNPILVQNGRIHFGYIAYF